MLINPNNTIVAGETEFCVCTQNTNFVISNIKQVVFFKASSVVFNILLPVRKVWQCPDRMSPLASNQPSWWIFEVHRNQQAVKHFIIVGDYVWLHS